MHMMLQDRAGDDYVVATGVTTSVRLFVQWAAAQAGFDLVWEGAGVEEVGRDRRTGKVIVGIDPRYFRPAEVDLLLGDPSKAERELGWKAKIGVEELVQIMMEHDLREARVRAGR
jgi:GDPmannose 4,6-dehydratase